MGKQHQYGNCHLCGKYRALTFEHVPPKCAFNNTPVKKISGSEILRSIGDDSIPWDLSKLRSRTQQKGRGGYFLCTDCNSNTGLWYVPFYEAFVRGVYEAIQSRNNVLKENEITIRIDSFRPLPVFKEIMVMFCDINPGFFDENLRSFLLEKESSVPFDGEKYRVFCYLAKGPIFRANGISATVINATSKSPLAVTMSEIINIPLGFALYIDKPEAFIPQGFEITSFSKHQYGDVLSCEMVLPLLESNSAFSGDYRPKEAIISPNEKVAFGKNRIL